MVEISLQLEISPANKIVVPGCEAPSAVSSKLLASAMRCEFSLVNLETALEAIPGSTVKFGSNFGRPKHRQRWFVLPPVTPECPCPDTTDYYEILRGLATDDSEIEEKYDVCDMIGMGFCPSPDFELTPTPDTSPYFAEGEYNLATGVLPPIPPWSADANN